MLTDIFYKKINVKHESYKEGELVLFNNNLKFKNIWGFGRILKVFESFR